MQVDLDSTHVGVAMVDGEARAEATGRLLERTDEVRDFGESTALGAIRRNVHRGFSRRAKERVLLERVEEERLHETTIIRLCLDRHTVDPGNDHPDPWQEIALVHDLSFRESQGTLLGAVVKA